MNGEDVAAGGTFGSPSCVPWLLKKLEQVIVLFLLEGFLLHQQRINRSIPASEWREVQGEKAQGRDCRDYEFLTQGTRLQPTVSLGGETGRRKIPVSLDLLLGSVLQQTTYRTANDQNRSFISSLCHYHL